MASTRGDISKCANKLCGVGSSIGLYRLGLRGVDSGPHECEKSLCGDRGGGSREARSKGSDVRALSAMMLRRKGPFSLSVVSQEALFVLNLVHTGYSSRTILVCCRRRTQKTSRISDYHLSFRIGVETTVLQACGMNYDTPPFLDHVVSLLNAKQL